MPTTEQVRQWLIGTFFLGLMFGPGALGGNHIARDIQAVQRQLEVQRQQQLDALDVHPDSLQTCPADCPTAPWQAGCRTPSENCQFPLPTATLLAHLDSLANCPTTPWHAVCDPLDQNCQAVQACAATPDHAPDHDGEPITNQSEPQLQAQPCQVDFLETGDEVRVIRPLWDGLPELVSTKGVDRGVRGTIIRTEKNRDGQCGVWVEFRGFRNGSEMKTKETIFAEIPEMSGMRSRWLFEDRWMEREKVFVPREAIGCHLERTDVWYFR